MGVRGNAAANEGGDGDRLLHQVDGTFPDPKSSGGSQPRTGTFTCISKQFPPAMNCNKNLLVLLPAYCQQHILYYHCAATRFNGRFVVRAPPRSLCCFGKVNKAWAGLGYYRRAKMLHEGAKKVMSDYGGSLPSTAKELKNLPGIGPYTAGATNRPLSSYGVSHMQVQSIYSFLVYGISNILSLYDV